MLIFVSLRTQTYFRLLFVSADNNVVFGRDKQQPKIHLRSQTSFCVSRVCEAHYFHGLHAVTLLT